MGHQHGHSGHDHSHTHAPRDFGAVFALGVFLNSGFVILELIVGLSIQSVALLADAGHNATDVFALMLAWGAAELNKLKPRGPFTFGFGQATIIASLLNAVLILLASCLIGFEAMQRFADPVTPNGGQIMVVAGIGVCINFATAWLFMRGDQRDINIKGAFLHMLWDGLVSLGVILAGGLIVLTGLSWFDPLISCVIVLIMVWGTWGLFRTSIAMALGGAPAQIDLEVVAAKLEEALGIQSVHDLHVWPLSTTQYALSAHLVVQGAHPGDAWLNRLVHQMKHDFGFTHATFQIELGDAEPCGQLGVRV